MLDLASDPIRLWKLRVARFALRSCTSPPDTPPRPRPGSLADARHGLAAQVDASF